VQMLAKIHFICVVCVLDCFDALIDIERVFVGGNEIHSNAEYKLIISHNNYNETFCPFRYW